jgi:hypothetical protein
MNNMLARTVSTCAIWAAVACALIFSGLFQIENVAAPVAWICVPAVLAVAAAGATHAVWKAGTPGHAPTTVGQAARADEGDAETQLMRHPEGKAGP